MTNRSEDPMPLWVTLVATVMGAGLSPVAPGTMGALCAMPIVVLLSGQPLWLYLVVVVVATAVGTLAADIYERRSGEPDPSRVVVDELAGILVSFIAIEVSWATAILGFSLFRLFDIWKPFPVGWLDRRLHGGWGIMADDLAAGGMTWLLLFVWTRML